MGSAMGMVVITGFPVMASNRSKCARAEPNRVSVSAAVSLTMAVRSYRSAKSSASANARENVQKDPHIAKPIRSFSFTLHRLKSDDKSCQRLPQLR